MKLLSIYKYVCCHPDGIGRIAEIYRQVFVKYERYVFPSLLFFTLSSFFIIRDHLIAEYRKTALRETGSKDSHLLLLYTAHPGFLLFTFSCDPLHKMVSDLCIYRARIGCVHQRAVTNHEKVFYSKLSVISFHIQNAQLQRFGSTQRKHYSR